MVKETLKDGNISNYHILAPKGKSLAFTGTMAGKKIVFFIFLTIPH